MANRRLIIFTLIFIITVITLFKARAEDQKPVGLTIVWHSGELGEYLIEMSKEYKKQTGVKINVELVPWDEWHDTIASGKKGTQTF